MVYFIWLVATSILALLTVPTNRIKALWQVAIIAPIMVYIIESVFVKLDYYTYHDTFLSINGIPLLQVLGWMPIGFIIIHFLPRKPELRLLWVTALSAASTGLSTIYQFFGTVQYGLLRPEMVFVISFASISAFISVSSWLIHEDVIFSKEKPQEKALIE